MIILSIKIGKLQMKYELILPTINNVNIHHTIVYQCEKTYNGTPTMQPGFSFTNEVRNRYCRVGPIGLG